MHLILQLEITKNLFIELGYWFRTPIYVQSNRTSMKSNLIMPFSIMAIAAVVLLFASGPVVGSQQAFAQWLGHPWNYWYGHSHWGGWHGGYPGWWWRGWHGHPYGWWYGHHWRGWYHGWGAYPRPY